MNWIQGLLITSIVALLVYLLRSRRSAQSQAWVKVGYLVFVLAGIYAVLRPNDTTVVAHWLGVDRGTDLMLYALIIAFSFTTLSTYLRFKDLELRYARLARAVALEGAQAPEASSKLADVRRVCRKYSTVRRTPSSSATCGRQPKTLSAKPMSRQDRFRSPSRGG